MRLSIVALVSASLALGACQQNAASVSPATGTQAVATTAGPAPAGFECPRPGTAIGFATNTRVYRGADPADPFICLFDTQGTGAATSGRLLGNFTSMPTTDDAAIRRGLFQLWPLTAGKRFSYSHAGRGGSGATFTLQHDIRVIGPRRMQIAGAEREVIVIENDRHDPNWTGYFVTWTFFYDPESRVVLGGDIAVIRGQDRTPSWRVTSVSIPR